MTSRPTATECKFLLDLISRAYNDLQGYHPDEFVGGIQAKLSILKDLGVAQYEDKVEDKSELLPAKPDERYFKVGTVAIGALKLPIGDAETRLNEIHDEAARHGLIQKRESVI